MLERDLRAERADVHVLAPIGGEADRVLAHQERAFADRADPRYGGTRHAHAPTVAETLATYPQGESKRFCYMCSTYVQARKTDGEARGGRIERFQVAAILLLLRERPAHGYDLLERLPELIGEERVDVGNLYRVLRALEEQGLVASEWDESLPGPAKRTYELTPRTAAQRSSAGRPRSPRPATTSTAFSDAIRGEEVTMHHRRFHRRRPPLGARFYASENVLERLDDYQRDLEQELADVTELIQRLRADEAPQGQGASEPQTI